MSYFLQGISSSLYVVFIMVMFLLQWPTLITLILFPVFLVICARLAHHEERDVMAEFGEVYADYIKRTPAFWPDWRRLLGNKVG